MQLPSRPRSKQAHDAQAHVAAGASAQPAADTEQSAAGSADAAQPDALTAQTKRPAAAPDARRRRAGVLLRLGCGGAVLCGLGVAGWIRHAHSSTDPPPTLPSAIYRRRIKKGMAQQAVESSCGRPDYAQQMNELGDEVESWYYAASDGTVQVVFDEGKVRNVLH